MIGTGWRCAAATLTMCCGLLSATPWQAAQAAPVVFQQASNNGTNDEAGRFTAVLSQGSNASQALLQLFTAPGPGSRISSLYVQDGAGAVGNDTVSGYPLVQLSQTQIYEVLLNSPGSNKVAVIKTLSSALGLSLSEAKSLVDGAPTVIRTTRSPDGNDQLKQSLENVGASVTLANHQDPSVPPDTNVGVTAPGTAPTGYDVVLAAAGPSKVAVIKAVRDLTGLSLADAKKLVDNPPSVIEANATRADAIAARQQLQDSGATVELKPLGTGSAGPGPITLPPGSTGFTPDIEVGFNYLDPGATPTLQLTLDLDMAFADLMAAWHDGRFALGLEVTDAAGFSDLYLAALAVSPAEVPEPSTLALLALPLFGLLGAHARRRRGVRHWRKS